MTALWTDAEQAQFDKAAELEVQARALREAAILSRLEREAAEARDTNP